MSTPKGTKPWNAGKGQGWTDKRGYRWISLTVNGKKCVRREHRVIIEKHLGRELQPWELVHHKDGNTANNAIENLELKEWGQHTVHHHTGGRKSEDARRRLEAFALMRETLKRERAIKSELLAFAEQFAALCEFRNTKDGAYNLARAAIAKVKGV